MYISPVSPDFCAFTHSSSCPLTEIGVVQVANSILSVDTVVFTWDEVQYIVFSLSQVEERGVLPGREVEALKGMLIAQIQRKAYQGSHYQSGVTHLTYSV